MDEVAAYDMPAILETVAVHTGQKGNIIFIGHSLGSTIALMYAAEYPEQSKEYIRLFLFMSPAYTLNNMISPMKGSAPFMNQWLVSTEKCATSAYCQSSSDASRRDETSNQYRLISWNEWKSQDNSKN